MIFCLILLVIAVSGSMSMKFTEMGDQSGLYFREISQARVSYDSFILVYHVNISSFFNIKNQASQVNKAMQDICEVQGNACDVLRVDMLRKLNRIQDYEDNIRIYEPSTSRQKRNPIFAAAALLTSVAFGTIDIIRMNRYEKMISDLKADYGTLHKIDVDQTIFLKENVITSKNAFESLANTTEAMTTEVENILKKTYEDLTWTTREMVIGKFRDLFEIWIDEHEYLASIILDHLENIKHGKMSHLIPMEIFRADLMKIEDMLTHGQRLPIDIRRENPLTIFNYVTTKSSIHEDKLFVELTIPKVDREIYNLFKIIPIPIFINNYTSIIIPEMEYVLIDEGQKSFTPLSTREVEDNLLQYNWGSIISPNDNIYHDFHDSCEMSLFIHPSEADIATLCNVRLLPTTNYFISLGTLNQYFVVITSPTTLLETCNNTITTRQVIDTSGKLTLAENCQIRTHKITLRSRIKTKIEEHIEMGIFSNINNVTFGKILENLTRVSQPQQLHLKKYSMLIDNHVEEFNALADHADDIMEQLADNSRFNEVYRDKLQDNLFVSGGMILFVAIIMTIFACCLYKRFYNVNTWTNLAGKLSMEGRHNQVVRYNNQDRVEIL